MREKLYSITWLRAMAVIFILLCHLVVQHHVIYITMLGQFFNVGTQIFIIISAFLFGTREISNTKEWIKKRCIRIFIPFWIFLIILSAVYLMKNISFDVKAWVLLIFGMQGSVVEVLGAEQTWFITVILICYAVTPLLYKFKQCEDYNILKNIICVILCIMPVIFALFESPSVYTLLSPVVLYSLIYLMSEKIKKSNGKCWKYFFIMGMMFGIRIVGKLLMDGSFLYDRILVVYTQSLIAVCFLIIFIKIFRNKKPNRIIEYIDNYSFEIYLVHYMLVVGPVSLMKVTDSWLLNSCLVIIISCILAFIIKVIDLRIIDLLKRKI